MSIEVLQDVGLRKESEFLTIAVSKMALVILSGVKIHYNFTNNQNLSNLFATFLWIFGIFKLGEIHFNSEHKSQQNLAFNSDEAINDYGYNLDCRELGTSEYCFTPDRLFHWSLIYTGEGMLTGSRVLCFDPVKIPSPVEIWDQWDGLFDVKQYSEVPRPLQSRL